jgi:hypothetical protein
MCDRQHQEPFAPSPACTCSEQRQTAVEARPQYEQTDEEREAESRQSLCRLQELICELLVRNQELRMSLLGSVPNKQSWEADQ